MLEYLKRKLSRLSGKVKIDTYPKYYEKEGLIIREEKDGTRYVVKLDENHNEVIVRGYDA
ncbi:MAG: hypothetical protein J6039_02045 [Alphaproteobacteria bacterium]|nr:hypothetical protein [Alphaproteobacteria bacterium]